MTIRAFVALLCFTACGPATALDVTSSTAPVTSAAVQAPGCPPTWAEARSRCSQPTPCSLSAARCSYPGVGDQLPNGQWADGLLSCFDQRGGTTDAGVGEWRCAQ